MAEDKEVYYVVHILDKEIVHEAPTWGQAETYRHLQGSTSNCYGCMSKETYLLGADK